MTTKLKTLYAKSIILLGHIVPDNTMCNSVVPDPSHHQVQHEFPVFIEDRERMRLNLVHNKMFIPVSF